MSTPHTTQTRSTCPYCGVGCGVIIESAQGQITGVRGDPDHPANAGRLCTKGSTLHLTAAQPLQRQMRAQQPMRRADRTAPLVATDWTTALDLTAQRLGDIVTAHGPDAVGLYLSGQLLTEDYYVFNKLAKGLLGTNNVDTNSRLCMSSAVAGYKASLGADAPPACYDDLNHAQTVFITGSNMAWAHPVLFRRLEDARRAKSGQRWVVVDPRRTETAAMADLHLQLQPGTDVMLHHALLLVMQQEGLLAPQFISAHTADFERLQATLADLTLAHAAQVCGLRADDIVQAARWFAGLPDGAPTPGGARQPTLSLYCQGLNQSRNGTANNSTLINLHLATGQIGRPGAGPLSLTGQPNAMGGREVGGLANLLSGHRDLANPQHRAEVAALWGVPQVPAERGKSAVQMFEAAADGQIKALWIVCTNPAQSMPDQATVRRALQRAEFVVLQEAYAHTATAAYADLLLPATTWAEKSGTVTNSERCISRVRPAVPAIGQARDDWRIAVDVAKRLEARLKPARVPGRGQHSLFAYDTPEQVWLEHRETTRGRDLDISGLSYAGLDTPQQWPCPVDGQPGQARLYTDHRFATADGLARFVATDWRGVAEVVDAHYPVALTTGRLRDQWHGMSRTGTLARLFAHAPEPAIELNPQDLAQQPWQAGDLLRVASRRGQIVLPVQPSAAVAPGQAFIAMHWGSEFLGGAGVNALTTSAHCPNSQQPELKHAAVVLAPAQLPWQLAGAAWLPAEQVWFTQLRLRQLFNEFEFASCVPFGREPRDHIGLHFRAAAASPVAPAIVQAIAQALGLAAHMPVLRYDDAARHQHRMVATNAQAGLQAYLLAGAVASDGWLLPMLQQERPVAQLGRALLTAGQQAPGPALLRSPQVCACHDVSEISIVTVLKRCTGSPVSRLAEVQTQLRCGTACGSCLTAVKTLVHQTTPVSQAA